ncbi:MAG: glycosyltransferase family 4 protein [Syntrophobacteraceae bacterium]
MHILILALHYSPDLGPSAPLFTMLGSGLAKRGHRVSVITTVPHYPSGSVPSPFRGRKMRRTFEEGVEVIRVPLPSLDRAKLGNRLVQFACYQAMAAVAGLGLQYDVVLVGGPSLVNWFPLACLVALRGKPAIYSVHDLYPDVGVTLGIFRHRFVIRTVAGMERFCMKRSKTVRISSESFRPGVRALGVSDSKMALVYDWVDMELIRPMPKDNAFAREHGLADKFVVLYAGNLGLSQGLQHVLAVADLLKDREDIRFVLVGEGAGLDSLRKYADEHDLQNVQFIPFQPRGRLPEVHATADVSLVTLQKGVGTASIPSKTFSILASGCPVLASVDEESDPWNLVRSSGAGICVPPESPKELADSILALRRDAEMRSRLGANGLCWAQKYHSPESAAEQFERLFAAALANKGNSLENYGPVQSKGSL